MKFATVRMAEQQKIHRLGAQTNSLPRNLEALLSYWLQKCSGRPMPARDELPVHELRPWMGHIALIEVVGESDFRIRLAGTNLIRRLGREATGLNVDELAWDIAQHLRNILRSALRGAEPVVAASAVQLGRTTVWHSDVVLPLSGAAGRLSTLMLCSYPVRGS